MYNSIICRYHEIATKGNNRSHFERTMLENLRRLLRVEFPQLRYRRVRGRIWMEFADRREFTASELDRITAELNNFFPFSSRLDAERKERTVSMSFDIGAPRYLKW